MDFNKQLIFFFSALGAFNAFILAFYFTLIANKKKFSNYFLSALLLVLSIRIIKSVFFYFNPELSGVFIQIGLSACILIGPFLYLYLRSVSKEQTKQWWLHIFPFFVGITIVGTFYPYFENRPLWRIVVSGIYIQWLVYIALSFRLMLPIFKKLFNKREKVQRIEIWKLSIFCGVALIWFAHFISSYTSYIVGALSFSFVFYLILLTFFFKIQKQQNFFEDKVKYKDKGIAKEMIDKITLGLEEFKNQELYLNADITISKLAKEFQISSHVLSQFMNNNLGKSFSSYINELRIEKAKTLLCSQKGYSIENIGYESGFNSKSTFYTTFKKITGITPSEYQKRSLV
ncbi:helix-turn-helix domain-containing protein [Tenacibaculum agarivorans]|uniref:helix-turn-helix domain-containing protein n=1 Tax=Tenacibaculum agarivorans TaxID=1908389 RepID=UPI00094B93AF|nr:helix-turn-helix domain-containing protein [Tenacibaculum agarivorans]